MLPRHQRALMVPDSVVLIEWCQGMMDDAAREPPGPAAWVAFRDGLLMAMLACRGRRLRAMAGLRVGHELLRHGEHYRVALGASLVKTGKPDRFELPEWLTPYVTRYLQLVRPALLAGRRSESMWITRNHERMAAKAIQARVIRHTKVRFGIGFGPHRFRHALATTAALRAPDQPELAAGVLGITTTVVEQHYNRAGQVQAAMTYAELIEAQQSRR